MKTMKTDNSWDVHVAAGFTSNHCVPIAIARAYATDPTDAAEVAEWAKYVVELINAPECPTLITANGTHHGGVGKLCEYLELGEVAYIKADHTAFFTTRTPSRTQLFPTVAQWLRANPNVTEAIVRTTGHAGYYKDGVGYGLTSRARVDHVIILAKK